MVIQQLELESVRISKIHECVLKNIQFSFSIATLLRLARFVVSLQFLLKQEVSMCICVSAPRKLIATQFNNWISPIPPHNTMYM